jgi:hypothetical protein
MTEDVFTQSGTPVPDTEDAPTRPEYTPMKSQADYEPKPKEYDNDTDSIRRAFRDLEKARQAGTVPQAEAEAEAEPLKRGYRQDGGVGDPVPENQTVEPRRAADDLSRAREIEGEQPNNLTAEIDRVRDAYNNPQAAEQPQPDSQPQPPTAEAQQPQDDPADEVRRVLENHPRVREALEAELVTVEQQRRAFAEGARNAAQVSAASVLSNWPELASLSATELPHALAAIAKVDPVKATAINGALQRTQALLTASQQAEAAQRQIQAQNLKNWVEAEEQKFEREVLSKESPESLQKIKAMLPEIIQQDYGLSREDVANALQTNPALRSAAFQSVLLDAAKFRMAQRDVAAKVHRDVRPVQKPGVSQPRGYDSAVDSALRSFRANPSPKSAAALLIAKREA